MHYSKRADKKENFIIHIAGMIHLFKYMKLQVFYIINQCVVIITESFDYHHEAEYFKAVSFLRALDSEEHVFVVSYASFI